MASHVHNRKAPELGKAFKVAIKKYASLFIIVFIIVALFYFLNKLIGLSLVKYFLAGHSRLLFLKSEMWLGPILLGLSFLIGILIQSAFTYAIPALIIGQDKLFASVIKSFRLFRKFFIPTITLVGLPMLLYIPFVVLSNNTAFLIDRFFPEVVLYVLILGAIFSSLVFDVFVTISTAFLYLMHK